MKRTRLRLLYYVESLRLGGANQTTLTVALELKRSGHEVWFASEDGPLRDLLLEAAHPHIPVQTSVRHPSPAAMRILAGAIRAHNIDLVCSNGFDCTLDAVPAGLITGCPVMPTYGGMISPPYPHPRLPRVNVFSEELSADLINNYNWKKETFHHLIARIDGTRFHPGISGCELRDELGIGETDPVLVMVCRQAAYKIKGIITLLNAALSLHTRLPSAKIVLLGDGDQRNHVLSMIEEIHAETQSTFIIAPGSSRRVPEGFAMADLVIANGARSALEGMACGKPVISVGPNGFCGVFSPRSIESFRRFNFDKGRLAGNSIRDSRNLVSAAASILSDAELRHRLGEFGLAYAREHLVVQESAPAYERLYAAAVEDPWGGASGRFGIAANWLATVARYYGFLLRRRFASAPRSLGDDLVPPPPGLDPDWSSGMIEKIQQ